MTELLSVGDRVALGRYRPLSRFSGALNFVRKTHRPGLGGAVLACVVSETTGAGPLNIVVRGDLAAVLSLEVRPGEVVFGASILPIRERYDSSLRLQGPGALKRNLAAFRDALREAAPEESLAFLLEPNGAEGRPSTFKTELARELREGYRHIMAGDLKDGASALKGRGFGLTPSGDDFLAGFMLGLHAAAAAPGLDLSSEIRMIRSSSRSRNIFSESFLRCAAEGRFFERAKALTETLFSGDADAVRRSSARLCSIGASSGADLGVGLYSALMLHIPQRERRTL